VPPGKNHVPAGKMPPEPTGNHVFERKSTAPDCKNSTFLYQLPYAETHTTIIGDRPLF